MEHTQSMKSKLPGNPENGQGIHEPVERAASGAHDTVDKIADASHRAADAVSEKGAQLKETQEEWLKEVREYVNEHPMQSVGIAVAGGFLLSRLLSGR